MKTEDLVRKYGNKIDPAVFFSEALHEPQQKIEYRRLKDLSGDEIDALPDSLGFLQDVVTAAIFLNLYVYDDVEITLGWADFEIQQAIGLLESAAEAIAVAQQGDPT